jgi:hypothetical protein
MLLESNDNNIVEHWPKQPPHPFLGQSAKLDEFRSYLRKLPGVIMIGIDNGRIFVLLGPEHLKNAQMCLAKEEKFQEYSSLVYFEITLRKGFLVKERSGPPTPKRNPENPLFQIITKIKQHYRNKSKKEEEVYSTQNPR